MTDPIRRIEDAIAQLGAEHEPPAGWEDRVLAATAPPRRWWWAAVPAVAAAAVVAIALWPRSHDVRVAIEIERTGAPTRAASATRGDTAKVGDILHATASDGTGRRALWVYRDDALVVACPGAPRCRGAGDAILVDVELALVGTYVIVALSSSAALPAPTGRYDDDVAGALAAGAIKHDRSVSVR
jgi:hypothetical protein